MDLFVPTSPATAQQANHPEMDPFVPTSPATVQQTNHPDTNPTPESTPAESNRDPYRDASTVLQKPNPGLTSMFWRGSLTFLVFIIIIIKYILTR